MLQRFVTLVLLACLVVVLSSGREQGSPAARRAARPRSTLARHARRSGQGPGRSASLAISHDGGCQRALHEPVVRRHVGKLATGEFLPVRDQVSSALGRAADSHSQGQRRPRREPREYPHTAFENSQLTQLKQVIDHKDRNGFARTYKESLTVCYSCHKAADKPYLRLQVPAEPITRIINFDPTADRPLGGQ